MSTESRCQGLQIPVSFCSTGSLNTALFVLCCCCCFFIFSFHCGQTVYDHYMMIIILNKLLISHPSPSTPRTLTDGLRSGSGRRCLPFPNTLTFYLLITENHSILAEQFLFSQLLCIRTHTQKWRQDEGRQSEKYWVREKEFNMPCSENWKGGRAFNQERTLLHDHSSHGQFRISVSHIQDSGHY